MGDAEAAMVRTFYQQAWNLWDDTVVDGLLSPDFGFRGSLGDEVRGRDGWRGYREKIRQAVPDFHNEIVDLVTAPGRAAVRLRYTGHHQGVMLGQQGRGQPIDYSGAAFFTCSKHHLDTAWVLGDLDSLRRQIAPG